LLGGAAPWMSDYTLTLAGRFLLGAGGAMWVTLMGSVVLAELPAARRPIANAVNGIAVNAGVITALALTLPLAATLGPRVTLTLASFGSGLCVLVLAAVGPIGGAAAPASFKDTLAAYVSTLRVSTTWLLAVAFCGPLALYLVLNTFLGSHLEASFLVPRASSMRWLSFMNL
jgi:predicted MFS family arabinose efflux permease